MTEPEEIRELLKTEPLKPSEMSIPILEALNTMVNHTMKIAVIPEAFTSPDLILFCWEAHFQKSSLKFIVAQTLRKVPKRDPVFYVLNQSTNLLLDFDFNTFQTSLFACNISNKLQPQKQDWIGKRFLNTN